LAASPMATSPLSGTDHFPDCWLAYGATNAELDQYGTAWPLAARRAWLLAAGQLALALALGAILIGSTAPAIRLAAGGLLVAVVASAAVTLARLSVAPLALRPRRDALVLTLPFGRQVAVPWNGIAEIGLAAAPGRHAVGLRLHAARGRGARLRARLNGGFDRLLYPADGDCELLGRVLLRYCIDAKARRRLPAAPR
jgi:hypothetical protein